MAVHAQWPACYFPAEALGPGFLRMVSWHSRRVHPFTQEGNRTAAAISQGASLMMQLGERTAIRAACKILKVASVLHTPHSQQLCTHRLLPGGSPALICSALGLHAARRPGSTSMKQRDLMLWL